MFDRLELQYHADGASKEATLYRIDFARLSARTQERVLGVFTQPRKPAMPERGSEFYKLSVTMEDGTRYGAEYSEATAHPKDLDMLDVLISEVRKCAQSEAEKGA